MEEDQLLLDSMAREKASTRSVNSDGYIAWGMELALRSHIQRRGSGVSSFTDRVA